MRKGRSAVSQWLHYKDGMDYRQAACSVATSDRPDALFTYHGHFRPLVHMSRDCTLFLDINGIAYFISAANDNADTHIYRLSSDFLHIESLEACLWPGRFRKAFAVFQRDGLYYMLSSGCTG